MRWARRRARGTWFSVVIKASRDDGMSLPAVPTERWNGRCEPAARRSLRTQPFAGCTRSRTAPARCELRVNVEFQVLLQREKGGERERRGRGRGAQTNKCTSAIKASDVAPSRCKVTSPDSQSCRIRSQGHQQRQYITHMLCRRKENRERTCRLHQLIICECHAGTFAPASPSILYNVVQSFYHQRGQFTAEPTIQVPWTINDNSRTPGSEQRVHPAGRSRGAHLDCMTRLRSLDRPGA